MKVFWEAIPGINKGKYEQEAFWLAEEKLEEQRSLAGMYQDMGVERYRWEVKAMKGLESKQRKFVLDPRVDQNTI